MTIKPGQISRREFIYESGVLVAGIAGVSWMFNHDRPRTETFIARVDDYSSEISSVIRRGMAELGVYPEEIRGKRILLKPNMVEVHRGAEHINTHPAVLRGAAEAFLSLGAKSVLVGEGAGHSRDSIYLLEESGLAETLREDHIPFIDLNNDSLFTVPNRSGLTRMKSLTLPASLKKVDWIVSVAKMKTHHWAGVTLSMKNLFGVMPGIVYGWPKNVLHQNGIDRSILDINAAVKPHFAIIDGIIGMEGDGPIMGHPKHAGVLVMGRNLPSVDATSARIMGIDPQKVQYLNVASKWLGPVVENAILQRGELIADVQNNFVLEEHIPAQLGLRIHKD